MHRTAGFKSAIQSFRNDPGGLCGVYDSTMARSFGLQQPRPLVVTDCLKTIPPGRIVPDAELDVCRPFFFDRLFRELISW